MSWFGKEKEAAVLEKKEPEYAVELPEIKITIAPEAYKKMFEYIHSIDGEISGTGRTPTQYTMLGAVMLPELRVLKIKTLPKSSKHQESLKNCDPYNTSNQRLNNQVGIFKGTTEDERKNLRVRGLL